MPIDSHADLLKFAKAEGKIGDFYKQFASSERRLADIRENMAKEYDQLIRIKGEAKRFLEEQAKTIEDISLVKGENSGVDKSKIDKAEMDFLRKEAASLDEDVKYYIALSEAIKTSTFQAKNVVEKLVAIGQGYEIMGEWLTKFVKADQTLFEKKDKLSDKKGQMEETKNAAGRSFDQAKADITRRRDEYNKELDKFTKLFNDFCEKMKY
ncbi:MAG: hypothetical protein GYA24_16500 [Candidatus Lokiarchaeota archaeon]|nr:hypothetical protein [Candidatus Lokiarchaeota archaeon]